MAEPLMVGARIPLNWQQQIQAIASASRRKEAEVVREAIAQHLGRTNPSSVKGASTSLEVRVSALKRKLVGLGRLVGAIP